ncbi:hypothetical protein [Ruegeria halocynthiae]|uniref:hypothetical protein n=1 Tax=Ruegeria halocynthiae TaxID=985054 RepID=UPI000563BBD1|nr:hypothetical protein [Ruegeria halocynthiae]
MYDSQSTADDQIELFCLTETAEDLPIPCDDELRDAIMRETFESLFSGMVNTGLHREIEPIVHGLASLMFRRRRGAYRDDRLAADWRRDWEARHRFALDNGLHADVGRVACLQYLRNTRTNWQGGVDHEV